MCCGDNETHACRTGHTLPGTSHKGMVHGMCSCSCGEQKILSEKEKVEMLEGYRKSLKNELEGVEEELKELQREP
jgi:hypothetical protein